MFTLNTFPSSYPPRTTSALLPTNIRRKHVRESIKEAEGRLGKLAPFAAWGGHSTSCFAPSFSPTLLGVGGGVGRGILATFSCLCSPAAATPSRRALRLGRREDSVHSSRANDNEHRSSPRKHVLLHPLPLARLGPMYSDQKTAIGTFSSVGEYCERAVVRSRIKPHTSCTISPCIVLLRTEILSSPNRQCPMLARYFGFSASFFPSEAPTRVKCLPNAFFVCPYLRHPFLRRVYLHPLPAFLFVASL